MKGKTLLLLSLVLTSVRAQTTDLDNEIIRLRRELTQAQTDMRRMANDIEKERKDLKTYRDRSSQRLRSLSGNIDSLALDIGRATRRNDSLGAEINALNARTRQMELAEDQIRNELASLCVRIEKEALMLPPLSSRTIIAAAALLRGELTAKTVDNAEASNRLIQMLSQMEDATTGIQTAQETSPLADIPGVVYRMRIGSLFEAIANEKGTRAALFQGHDAQGAPVWKMIDDPEFARAVVDAVNIREGKRLPAFARLPLDARQDTRKGDKE